MNRGVTKTIEDKTIELLWFEMKTISVSLSFILFKQNK